jgi:hypothetical protein
MVAQAHSMRTPAAVSEPRAYQLSLFPVFLILALLTTVTTLQNYFVLSTGGHSLTRFLRMFCSAGAYFGYFIPLAVVARGFVRKHPIGSSSSVKNIVLHSAILLV